MKDEIKDPKELRKILHDTLDKLPDWSIEQIYKKIYPGLMAFIHMKKGGKA